MPGPRAREIGRTAALRIYAGIYRRQIALVTLAVVLVAALIIVLAPRIKSPQPDRVRANTICRNHGGPRSVTTVKRDGGSYGSITAGRTITCRDGAQTFIS